MLIETIASGSSGNCVLISDGATHLLLDAGISRKQIAEAIRAKGLPGVDAVLVSHGHGDHSKGVKGLLRMGIDVYMSKGTAKELGVEDRVKIIGAYGWGIIGTFKVSPFEIRHDAQEPLGFRLESAVTGEALCYATDTQYIPPAWGNGCTHLLLEANYSLEKLKENVASGEIDGARKHRVLWQHQSIDTVLKFLRATDRSRLQSVWLLHLSNANSDEIEFKRAVEEIVGCPVHIA